MNVAKAINAGALIFKTDSTFKICKREICILGIRVAMLGGETATVGFSINLTVSANAFRGFSSCISSIVSGLEGVRCTRMSVLSKKKYVGSSEWKVKFWSKKKFPSDDGKGYLCGMALQKTCC